MKIALRGVLTAIFCVWSFAVLAQGLEIIELRHRSVDQVLPVLLPLVEPGGTLTGMNTQLFLKASPGNRAEIRRALAAIDTPARRLIIRIAHNRQAGESTRGGQGSGTVTLGGTSRANVQANVWDTRSVAGERSAQMVQTVEGGAAFIQVGRALAVPMRQAVVGPAGAIVNEGVIYRDIGSGFYATPHVNGQRVTLEISQQAEQVEPGRVASGYGGAPGYGPQGPGAPSVSTQRLKTTVSGRLGEWIELGGTGRQASGQQGGAFSVGTSDVRDNRSIWLMVEEAE